MNIGWLSHCLENSGWSRACRGYLRAAATQDVNIKCFPVTFNPMKKENIPEDLMELLVGNKKQVTNIDSLVCHTLPRYFEKLSVPSIGCAMYETYNRYKTLEHENTNIMDEIWQSNSQLPENLLPTYNIPYPVEPEVYQQVPVMACDEIKDTYVFYNIAELSKRKNIWAGVVAYYSAFTIDDPVTLLLKLRHPKTSAEQLKQECYEQLVRIQESCNIHKNKSLYPKVVIETDSWNQQQVLGLHDFGDCFLSTAFGEAWCYPLMDALVRGNQAISTPHEGARELQFLSGNKISLCDAYEDLVYDHPAMAQYNTSNEHWLVPSRLSISKLMREMFNRGKLRKEVNSKMVNELSYENIGKKMMERFTSYVS